jgi:hypothetical protein
LAVQRKGRAVLLADDGLVKEEHVRLAGVGQRAPLNKMLPSLRVEKDREKIAIALWHGLQKAPLVKAAGGLGHLARREDEEVAVVLEDGHEDLEEGVRHLALVQRHLRLAYCRVDLLGGRGLLKGEVVVVRDAQRRLGADASAQTPRRERRGTRLHLAGRGRAWLAAAARREASFARARAAAAAAGRT